MRGIFRFLSDRSGTTAVLFGLSLFPVLGFAGAAVDFGRMTSERSRLQNAVDFTALALGREGPCAEGGIETIAERHFKSFYKLNNADATLTRFSAAKSGRTVTIEARAEVEMSIMRVMGFERMSIAAVSGAAWSNKTIELALVLDNTGSMGDWAGGKRKIDELKKASQSLLATLDAATCERGAIKVAVVPFDTQVRLDTTNRDANWLRYDPGVNRTNWKGYVEDRDQPYDIEDAAPIANIPASLYPAAKPQWGPSELAAVQPLVDIKTGYSRGGGGSLSRTIQSMNPRGNTNITLGLAWGMAALSTRAPLTEGSSNANVEKVIVLLTDGDNTQMRRNGSTVTNARTIDARTQAACGKAKGSATVISIRLLAGNATLLRDCASKPTDPANAFYRGGEALYHDVQNPAQLDSVFRDIATQILGMRVTR